DNFKPVNDIFGHDMGDSVLRLFADIVKSHTRAKDVVCRFGGDEFVAFFEDIADEKMVASLARRLNDSFVSGADTLLGKDHGIPLGISMGVARVPDVGRNYKTLFNCADNALYTVKKNGKHSFYIYKNDDSDIEDIKVSGDALSRIVKVVEERGEGTGPMILGIDSFSVVYKFIERYNRKCGFGLLRILCSVTAKVDNKAVLKTASNEFENVLKNALDRSDVVLHHRTNQFFIVIPYKEEPECDKVIKKINDSWNSLKISSEADIDFAYDHK
nr:GGDEF domain-containing protein [Lachnospiraceae bacterium]